MLAGRCNFWSLRQPKRTSQRTVTDLTCACHLKFKQFRHPLEHASIYTVCGPYPGSSPSSGSNLLYSCMNTFFWRGHE
eukprot:513353-Amphidinium_carterae.1